MADLLPCPFCGAAAKAEDFAHEGEWITCPTLGCAGEANYATREAWNRRAHPQADAPAGAMMPEGKRIGRLLASPFRLEAHYNGERTVFTVYAHDEKRAELSEAELKLLNTFALGFDVLATPGTPPKPSRTDASNLMWQALRRFIYETTHLSPQEDDGAHKCRISAKTLADGRAALEAYEWEDIHAAGGIFQEERAALLAKEGQ